MGGGLYPVYPHDGDQVPFDLAASRPPHAEPLLRYCVQGTTVI